MRLLRGLLALALLALVLLAVLAWTAPAEVAYRYARSRLGPIELADITGSVWAGRAGQVVALGRPIGSLEWTVDKSPLLSRRVAAALKLGGAGIEADASIDAGNDVVVLRDLDLVLPAELLGPALDIPSLVLEGRVVLDVAEARIAGGYLQSARGTATWSDIGIRGAALARLPGVRAEFAPGAGGAIEATIRDLGGALAIEGTVTIRDGAFRSETRLWLREPSPQLADVLRFIGERTADGASILRIEGELKKLW